MGLVGHRGMVGHPNYATSGKEFKEFAYNLVNLTSLSRVLPSFVVVGALVCECWTEASFSLLTANFLHSEKCLHTHNVCTNLPFFLINSLKTIIKNILTHKKL